MEYYNLDLSIERRTEGRYPVKARSQTQGEVEGALALDPASPEIVAGCAQLAGTDGESRARDIADTGVDASDALDRTFLQHFGGLLWDGLFRDDVRDLYRSCLGEVQRDDSTGVRIRLCIEAPEVAVLPWELLYDHARDAFLATSTETPLTRYINLHEPIRNLQTRPPVRVLIVIPAASGLDVQAERDSISRALCDLGPAVAATVLEGPVTRSAIRQALVSDEYHVFHFIGHGAFTQDEGHLIINS
ncbi:MAG: CHAT domain-containing protein, partial [Vicinamibacterales bacterium]